MILQTALDFLYRNFQGTVLGVTDLAFLDCGSVTGQGALAPPRTVLLNLPEKPTS